jgi:hypothetical protein
MFNDLCEDRSRRQQTEPFEDGFSNRENRGIILAVKLLKNMDGGEYEMVRPAGIEPATLSLEG